MNAIVAETWKAATKRLFDVLVAAVLLILAAPLMAVIALLVKLDSPGTVLYRQNRVGLNRRRHDEPYRAPTDRRCCPGLGRIFRLIKFRTMRMDAERNGAVWSNKGDLRVTRVGRVLRKTHLDELPQLVIVLFGDMSIVGPRPERPEFVQQLKDAVPNYAKRLCVKPGVTGLAQIRRDPDETIDDVRRKIRFDRLYLRNAGPWADVKIVVGTIPLALGLSPSRLRRAIRLVLNGDPKTSLVARFSLGVQSAPLEQRLPATFE